ncbi:autotransporter outer membrane beta-barrel domain-containing protein [Flavisphingomonas formosensis]|uniref:autotransporter outer membrane beta-barrel domain-containing protein n=1 Tax=Flavisphingomonas formosensis TaxID=861534 RepID=UPI0012FC2523|nr:autotransporter domain-containing protein [Sphingomonas formosensis]
MSRLHYGALASALAIAVATTPAMAADVVVAGGTTRSAQATVGGTDTVTVEAGGTFSSASDPAIKWSSASTGLVIDNAGTIESTASAGRAINASGSANPRSITLNNQAGAVIQSEDDAFRINLDVTSGTIIVNNAGTIRTTNGGQAIDFDAIASSGATIQINNLAGGVMQSYGQDAIRSGQGSVIDNAGLIYSDGALGSSYDGIDMQGHSATVINEATGVISGLRHGITSDVDLTVTNYGSITGRNGSGVGSDGNGTVVNHGTITGAYNGVSANGDGDGVDIDFIGTVTNYGTIQGTGAAGVDKGGQPNSSEGIAMGGGTIVNASGATISGLGRGILIDDGSAGSAYGATTIINAGTIKGLTGPAISLVGNYDDSITNSGTIGGGNGIAIEMGAGNDTLTLLPGSTITGSVDGGDGNDAVVLAGSGSGSFAGAINFETLSAGYGSWTFTGDSTFSGGTTVGGGAQLFVTGVLRSAVTVSSAGTLGGTGTVSAVSVHSGGAIAPGVNGVGSLRVNGNYVQQGGSIYAADITAGGAADRLFVAGTATLQSGAILSVTRAAGSYTPGTRYVLLSATNGIAGTYQLQQASDPDTELRLGSDGSYLYVDVARTGGSLIRLGTTPNQKAVAAAFVPFGIANPAYAALTLTPSDAATRTGLDKLSGELHASVRTALAHDALAAEGAVKSRLDSASDEGISLWGQFLGGHGKDDRSGVSSKADRYTLGGVGGIDMALGEHGRIGIAAGYTRTRLRIDDLSSSARVRNGHVLGYAGGSFGGFALRAGGGYSWGRISTQRSVAFTGFSDQDAARYDGNVLHGFAEAGHVMSFTGGTAEPYAGFTALRVHTDSFVENGGVTALAGRARMDSVEFANLGLRLGFDLGRKVTLRGSMSWQHAFDTVRPDAVLNFVAGSTPFTVLGAALSRDAAAPTVDFTFRPAAKLRLAAGYSGLIGNAGTSHAGRVTFGYAF